MLTGLKARKHRIIKFVQIIKSVSIRVIRGTLNQRAFIIFSAVSIILTPVS